MVRVSVSLPSPLYKRLMKMAKQKDLSLSGLLRHGIEIYADSQAYSINEIRRTAGLPLAGPKKETWVPLHQRPKRKRGKP